MENAAVGGVGAKLQREPKIIQREQPTGHTKDVSFHRTILISSLLISFFFSFLMAVFELDQRAPFSTTKKIHAGGMKSMTQYAKFPDPVSRMRN